MEGLIFFGIDKKTANSLIIKYPDRVQAGIEYGKKQGGNVRNIGGLVRDFIVKGWEDGAKQHAKEKKEKNQAEAKKEALMEKHEQQKRAFSQAFMKHQKRQIKDCVSGWSDDEEKRNWSACKEYNKNDLFSFRFSKKKGLDKWLTMIHRQHVREYLTAEHNQNFITEEEYRNQAQL